MFVPHYRHPGRNAVKTRDLTFSYYTLSEIPDKVWRLFRDDHNRGYHTVSLIFFARDLRGFGGAFGLAIGTSLKDNLLSLRSIRTSPPLTSWPNNISSVNGFLIDGPSYQEAADQIWLKRLRPATLADGVTKVD
jgi:hypothetical protein